MKCLVAKYPLICHFATLIQLVPKPISAAATAGNASLNVGVAYARRLFEVVERFGLPRAALLQHARVAPADWEAAQARVPLAALVALFQSALVLTGRRDLGLEFGRQVRPGTFDALGYALMTCRNLGEAIGLVPLYRRLVFDSGYSVTAFANVNNYIAITTKGKAKRKGLYAATSLSKNPTMEVCSKLAVDYLRDSIHPRDGVAKYVDVKDYVAIRAVKAGGIQYDSYVEVDDWVLVKDLGTKDNEWFSEATGKTAKRKSRPHPVEIGVGGEPFGRVARWLMTTDKIPPLSYVGSGNKVPKTEGARVCMTLPSELPKDIDFDWYVNETLSMLKDMGVDV